MVNLSDPINRAVVKQGLALINRRQRPAWQLLAEQLSSEAPMREDTIGFQISPRINALSRMGDDGHTALKWLTTHDMRVAQQSWVIMNQNNDDRKDEQALCESLALEQAQQQINENRFIIICHVPEASHGVVGLAAGRIAMSTGRPAIVFSDTDKGQITGSARSILGYDIRDLLERAQTLTGLMSKYGGHAAAAGLTLAKRDDLEPFSQVLNQLIEIDFANQAPEAMIYHDGELPLELLRPNGLSQLEKLSPFGQGFAQPSFVVQAPVNTTKTMGKNGQHLRLSLSVNNESLEAVWFNAPTPPRAGDSHRFVVTLGENHFRGKVTLQAMILACE
jgi:single-stranded-DNA-specific exonuclease